MSRPLYIFDLDGTLADARHRLHFIAGPGKKDWRAFFRASAFDPPIREGIATVQALRRGGAEIWVWTGRSDEVERETRAWLSKYGVLPRFALFPAPERLRMRPAGDTTPDHRLKMHWLDLLDPPERDRLTAVFEDRSSVVAMWRASGVPCFQVAPGDF